MKIITITAVIYDNGQVKSNTAGLDLEKNEALNVDEVKDLRQKIIKTILKAEN